MTAVKDDASTCTCIYVDIRRYMAGYCMCVQSYSHEPQMSEYTAQEG